jgi:PRC-barrel domain protein
LTPEKALAMSKDVPKALFAPLRMVGAAAIAAIALTLSLAAAEAPTNRPADEATAPTPSESTILQQFPRDHLLRILGKDVLSATGADMGRIVDVLFTEKGEPRAAIIDFGGFLGVGTRKIAIEWSALRFDMGEKKNVIVLDIGRDRLKSAPEFKDSDKPIAVVTLPQFGANEPDRGRGR